MTAKKGGSANAPAEARDSFPDALNRLLQGTPDPDKIGLDLAKLFQVKPDEVALFRLEKGFLRFVWPAALRTAGTIPLSSSAAVSAHTASNKKAELFNNFPKVKHATVFENIKLRPKPKASEEQPPIQKLISAPLLDEEDDVLGVIQVCRKGADLSCGPDFSLDDLHHLELTAKVLAAAAFMQPDAG